MAARSTRRILTPLLAWLLVLLGCAAPPSGKAPDARPAPQGDASADVVGQAPPPAAGEDPFQETLMVNKNGTVYTDIDRYDVRNIRFNTGQGFGAADALVGYYKNTRFEIRKRFIDKLVVLGRLSPSEILAAPNRYDMVDDKDIDYIFRTELTRVDGERIEFIVRINQISGELQEGGTFTLTGDELQTLRKIVFY